MRELFFPERGLYYRTNDIRPERVTLVLIHGLSGSVSAWAGYEEAWEREYNVVSMDLRGHGKSLKPSSYADYALEAMAEDINALLDHLKVDRYIVMSQSYATLIAVLLLRRRTGAKAAIFMSSVYRIYSIPLTRISRALVHTVASVAGWFTYGNRPGRHVDYSKFRRAGDWNVRRIFTDIPNTTWHVWLWCLDHAYARDLDPLWLHVHVPTLIMHGRRDQISPVASAERLAKVLPSARLVILDGTSHVFPITQPERARRQVSEYLHTLNIRA